MRRILILGLDGMTWEVVEPLMAAGELPAFRTLCDLGVWGTLESPPPTVTSSAWPSLLTGKNPGQHGVWGFRYPRPGSGLRELTLVTQFDYDAMPLWRILQRSGRRGAFFNVPCAFPLDPQFSAGILTSGYMTPTTEREFAYPRSFRERILARYPDFEFKLSRVKTAHRELVARGIEIARMKFDIIRDLRREGPWDVLFAVVDEPDTIQHALWSAIVRREPGVTGFYRFLDREIGRLAEDLDRAGEILLVVSDHGFRSVTSLFCVNEAMERKGYLKFRRSRWPAMLRSMAADLFRTFPLGGWAIEQRRSRVLSRSTQPLSLSRIFGAISALAVGAGGACAGIFTERRESEFIEGLYRDLSDVLLEFPDVQLFRAADLYHGRYFAEMPPLVVASRGVTGLTAGRHGTLTRSISLSGQHAEAGLILAVGPGIRPTHGVSMAIYDVLPTVLSFLGLPVPNDLDGSAAPELLPDGGPGRMYDVRTGAVYVPDAPTGPLVLERLRRLRLDVNDPS